MSFSIVTDASANFSLKMIDENEIKVIPISFFENGKEYAYTNADTFNDEAFYSAMRNGLAVDTPKIDTRRYLHYLEPMLAAGMDILLIMPSSGISTSVSFAEEAKTLLQIRYPERHIELVDSLSASFGQALLVLRAVKCKNNGMTLQETADRLRHIRKRVCQLFLVDSLTYLKRAALPSKIVAETARGFRHLLKGDEEGKLIPIKNVLGRRHAISLLADKYVSLVQNAARQIIGITYSGCKKDAEYLAKLIQKRIPLPEIQIVKLEPAMGSLLGPGSLALFFEGAPDVRCH